MTFIQLHEQLQLIYGEWVRPETHTFLNEVLEFFPFERKQSKINIVLTNDYMFFESNLTWLFSSILNNNDIAPHFAEENPTVFLPKIDYDNPLNWTILAHECGHTDLKGIEKLLSNPKLISTEIIGSNKIIFENWVEEIYCDLIATKTLGPAYLASFCTFILLISGIEGNEISNETHPSNVLRINLIQEYLESRNIKIPLNDKFLFEGNSDFEFLLLNFMVENYNETSRKYLNPDSFHDSPNIDTTLLLDTISEEVDDIINFNFILTKENFKRIDSLKERLPKGITIASFQDVEKLKEAQKKYPKEKVKIDDLNEAKESLQEKRAKLWEIINSGWINKIENIIPNAIQLFFENEDYSFTKKMEILNNELEKNDGILLKSIESSEIFKIMEG